VANNYSTLSYQPFPGNSLALLKFPRPPAAFSPAKRPQGDSRIFQRAAPPPQQLADALVARQPDLLAEVDEHRLVARRAEFHGPLRLTAQIRCSRGAGCFPGLP
jgi:hypothetical protein